MAVFEPMKIDLPELSLVVLIGTSGSGKSTFARKHFKPTEVLSSDYCRGLVSDDENDQAATNDAFEVLHFIAAKRLAAGRLTVVDATNVQPEARKPLVALAREYHCLPVAIVLNLPEQDLPGAEPAAAGPRLRPARHPPAAHAASRARCEGLKREGFRHVFVLEPPEEVDGVDDRAAAALEQPASDEHGPFDIIGDVHGCCDELEELLATAGLRGRRRREDRLDAGPSTAPRRPQGRLPRRPGGPRAADPRRAAAGHGTWSRPATALCVPGNHDMKLHAEAQRQERADHARPGGVARRSSRPARRRPPEFRARRREFLDGLVSHYVLDDGKLVVAHAGMKEEMQGRGSGKVRDFALYGETTGETDEFGLPVRYNWAAEYRGHGDGRLRPHAGARSRVAQPHDQHRHRLRLRRQADGPALSRRRSSSRSRRAQTYCEPAEPFLAAETHAPGLTAQQQHDDLLDIEDVLGKRIISTRLRAQRDHPRGERHGRPGGDEPLRRQSQVADLPAADDVAVRDEPASRACWSIRPRRSRTSATSGVPQVVCEEKHMGSRAVVIVCRDEDAARKRFGVIGDGTGIVYTRTGRRFFDDRALESAAPATEFALPMDAAGFWDGVHHRLGLPGLRADAVVGQGPGAAAQPVCRRGRRRAGRACRGGRRALERPRPDGVGRRTAICRRRCAVARGSAERLRRAPTGTTAGRSSRSTTCKLAPFHLLATEGEGPRRPATTSGTWRRWRAICRQDERPAARDAVPASSM